MSSAPQVLIVDDDVALAEVTCEVLGFAGVPAIYRTTVIDATEALVRHADSIAVILTDVHLATPMSGIELAVLVAEEWPGVGICVMSGVFHEKPKQLPERAMFILKPWRSEDLVAAVNGCRVAVVVVPSAATQPSGG